MADRITDELLTEAGNNDPSDYGHVLLKGLKAERALVEQLDEIINIAVTALDTLERGRDIVGTKIDRARYTKEAKAAIVHKWNKVEQP